MITDEEKSIAFEAWHDDVADVDLNSWDGWNACFEWCDERIRQDERERLADLADRCGYLRSNEILTGNIGGDDETE